MVAPFPSTHTDTLYVGQPPVSTILRWHASLFVSCSFPRDYVRDLRDGCGDPVQWQLEQCVAHSFLTHYTCICTLYQAAQPGHCD